MKQPVVLLASEMYPFSKSGGLGDVMGVLPVALHNQGIPTCVITPFYGRMNTAEFPITCVTSNCHVGYPWDPITCEVYETDFHGVKVYFIGRGEYFDRRYYYNTPTGDYFDNCERFLFFCQAALRFLRSSNIQPAVLHAHDWQSACAIAYVHFLNKLDKWWANTKTVLTIHNLAFQGRFSSRLFENSRLPQEAWHMDGVEFWGDFNLLKAGIAYADKITTVSPSYAREILGPNDGFGLEGILHARQQILSGILNGADYNIWNPDNNKFLPATYSVKDQSGKHTCKQQVLKEFDLDPALINRPLLGFIGRLREQKGIDLLLEILPEIMKLDVGIVILGEGDTYYEELALKYSQEYPHKVRTIIGYTEEFAHKIQAASDIFLMPSHYEPCGLTQIYALSFGSLPVATAVGGLRDTVKPWPSLESTGFTFGRSSSASFLQTIQQAVNVYDINPVMWKAMRTRAMQQNFSWEQSAENYHTLYKNLGL